MIINDLLLERQVYVVFFLGGGGVSLSWGSGRYCGRGAFRGGVKVISLVQKLFQAIYYFLLIRGGGWVKVQKLSQSTYYFLLTVKSKQRGFKMTILTLNLKIL